MKKLSILLILLVSGNVFSGTRFNNYYMKPVILGLQVVQNTAFVISLNENGECIKVSEMLDTLDKTTEEVSIEECRGFLISKAIVKKKASSCEPKQKALVIEGKIPYGFKILAEEGAYSSEERELNSDCVCSRNYNFEFMDSFGKSYSQFAPKNKCLSLFAEEDRKMVFDIYDMTTEELQEALKK